jgi:putative hemolysin
MEQFIQKLRQGEGVFERKVPISLANSRYLLKTVENFGELSLALRLRHDVFFAWGLGRKLPDELDVDPYDADSDHLVVIEKETGKIVGNYRIRSSAFHSKFYSEDEFGLEELLSSTKQCKIEIGRACIHPEHRTGAVIQLLWRGLLVYMRATEARYLFGCSSISTRVSRQVEHVWKYLNENQLIHDQLHVFPRNPFAFRDVNGIEVEQVELPPLLTSYIRSGAKVLGPPAFDPEFECADFFTLLDLNDLTEKRARRYESVLQSSLV